MTPDARDRAVAEGIVGRFPPPVDVLIAAITAALATARAEERAACVAVVASLETAHECCECSGLLDAQAALRARGEG